MSRGPADAVAPLKVWDGLVRSLHWLLAASVAIAWISGHWMDGRRLELLHEVCGYIVAGVVAVRIAWGFIGSRHARFSDFVRGPAVVLRYARALRSGAEQHFIGHNPLGGWMVLSLLFLAGGASLTGILYTTDWLWGYAWLETLHRVLSWALLVAIVLHVAGVAFTGRRQRERLVMAMFTGWKRPRGPSAK